MSRSAAITELLFATFPLIRLTHGDKRIRIQRAWIDAAQDNALTVLGVDASLLPRDPREAASALMTLAMQIGRQAGYDGVDISNFFNDRVGGALAQTVHPDDTIAAAHALLAIMAARRLEARDPITTEERNRA